MSLLTAKYGIPPEDIIIDPLVFPCATGDENYVGGAVETIEAIRLIKENIPFVKTDPGRFQYFVWSAGVGARGGEFGFSVLRDEGRARSGDRECGEAGAVCFHSRTKSASWRRICCSILRRPMLRMNRCATAPEDWRQQTREQKIAINQFHIAAITDHFRKAGKKEKSKAASFAAG